MSKEGATKVENQVATIDQDLLSEFEQVAGTGFENVTASDLAIPFYSILQALSPQVKKGPLKIEGAEEGSIFNTVTQEVVRGDEGITVIPCGYMKRWVEWIDRNSGGGFVAQHEKQPVGIKQVTSSEGRIRNVLPNGHDIVETAYFFVLRVLPTGNLERALIAMASTQHKAAKKWVKLQMDFTVLGKNGKILNLPSYAQVYNLTTKMESKGNNSWAGWDIGMATAITNMAIYKAAQTFNQFVRDENPIIAPPVDLTAEDIVTTDVF